MGDTGSSSSPDDETDALLRTPCAAEDEGGPLHPDVAKDRGQTLRLTGQILAMTGDLLPTPRASDGPNGGPGMRGSKGDRPLPAAVHHLLPTPMVGSTNPAAHGQISGDFRRRMDEAIAVFGRFAPAIRRWEQVLGRPAPPPTEYTGRGGAARLSPRFVEWMMGLPDGWVTDITIRRPTKTPLARGSDPEQAGLSISRSQQLKALGNGVVPQQGAAAIADMLDAFERTPKETT